MLSRLIELAAETFYQMTTCGILVGACGMVVKLIAIAFGR